MSAIVRRQLSRLRLFLIGDSLKRYRRLKLLQWIDRENGFHFQKRLLRNLLLHAYIHVPYYRKLFDSVKIVNNASEVNFERFNQLPFLDKPIIRKNFEELKSGDLKKRKWYEATSGGSTGEPIRLIQDSYFADWRRGFKFLYDSWTEYTLSEPKILLWGSERDLYIGKKTFKTKLIKWLNNEVQLNAFVMSPKKMYDFVEGINFSKPTQILAYAESLYELSLFIERKGLSVHSPRAIMTSAGTLFEEMRETMERVFRAPVFNRYGSRELGDIACECSEHKGLHVSLPTHYVEIVRSDGSYTDPGEVGELIISSLSNYAMPLIRYKIGDLGMWHGEACTCKRSWPLLKKVVGRVTDSFRKRDGTLITLCPFDLVFERWDWLERYQIIQEDFDYIRVLLVCCDKNQNLEGKYYSQLRESSENIRFLMGKDCRVEYEFVDDIPKTPSGKHRYTISKIAR